MSPLTSGSGRREVAAAQDQDLEVLRTILSFYKTDAKHQQGDTAQMLQLRQAQLGLEALARIEVRLARV